MKTKTIQLAYPIEAGGATIAAVTIRRPKAKDLRALDTARAGGASEVEQSMVMIEGLTGLPREVVDELDATDFAALGEAVADFFSQPAPGASGAA